IIRGSRDPGGRGWGRGDKLKITESKGEINENHYKISDKKLHGFLSLEGIVPLDSSERRFELTFEKSAYCTFEVKLLLPKKRKTEENKEDKKFDISESKACDSKIIPIK
ncbi:hypothetical protein BpHYR1_043972, partial [Brachionus plicatilis]